MSKVMAVYILCRHVVHKTWHKCVSVCWETAILYYIINNKLILAGLAFRVELPEFIVHAGANCCLLGVYFIAYHFIRRACTCCVTSVISHCLFKNISEPKRA